MEDRNKKSKELVNEENEEYSCGIGSWNPQWLQKLATPKMFLINFSLVAIVQGASFTYMIGSITNLERRYGFDSKISGLILTADNLSQMFVNPIIGYMASRYNRPLIMAIGEMIVALSCFMSAIPYFIYGAKTEPDSLHASIDSLNRTQFCDPNRENICSNVTNWTAVGILWAASFINGIGYTVGVPYMDDNTSKKNSPMYLSLTGALRLLGPSMGFLLSSLCLSVYENPFANPGLTVRDPRWIGAWWIGFIVIGTLIILVSLPMMIFPKQMISKENMKKEENTEQNKSQIFESLKRILTNPIFMFSMIGMCLRIMGYLGYYLFKPKYMESQFGITSSNANFWTGLVSIPPMAIGIIAGGLYMSKYKPGAQKVVIYIFIIDMITNMAILSIMFIKCPHPVFAPTQLIPSNSIGFPSCFDQCGCTKETFHPICAKDKVYFNHCYAGCTADYQTRPDDCPCIGNDAGSDMTVKEGLCTANCNKFPTYLTVLGIAGIVMSTAKVGDTLIILRCVEPRDKNFAMGIFGSFLAVLTYIPYPPLFGWITDMSCLDWKESCKKTGNCLRYDIEKLRHFLHLSAFGIIMIGTLLTIPVIFYANRIKDMFEDEEDNENKLYELGAVNEGFNQSLEVPNNNNGINVVKIVTNLKQNRRKSSLQDYEIIHRKSSFVAL